jgi:tellurite resistance protein TehA-like permease
MRLHAALRTLSPGYFAMVMATGILSVGLDLDDHTTSSAVLLVTALVAFVVLLLLTAWRLVAFPEALSHDFTHPQRGFGFYTVVAAADVLASRLSHGHREAAVVLLIGAGLCWLARSYALPWTTRLGAGEHPIVAAANGSWFMWAVGAQSVAVAAAALGSTRPSESLALLCLAAWGIGLFLYALDGILVVIRLMAFEVTPSDITPTYWIAMGAAAITALAGTRLATLPPGQFADVARELARGTSVLAWVVASGLVPPLCGMGWWLHVTHRVPFRYTADLWSMVFPLGMYAVAGIALGQVEHLPWLGTVGSVALVVALLAWVAVAVLAARHVVLDVLLPG